MSTSIFDLPWKVAQFYLVLLLIHINTIKKKRQHLGPMRTVPSALPVCVNCINLLSSYQFFYFRLKEYSQRLEGLRITELKAWRSILQICIQNLPSKKLKLGYLDDSGTFRKQEFIQPFPKSRILKVRKNFFYLFSSTSYKKHESHLNLL